MIDHSALLRPRPRRHTLVYVAAVAMALIAVALGQAAYVLYQEAATLVASNEDARTRLAAARPQPSRHEEELKRHWLALRQDRTFPWAKLFRAVEHVADPEIELLEFRPDRRQGTLVLKGEGRTAEDVMRYLERLQADPTFSRVYLAHTATVERGRLLTRSFELRLSLDSRQFVGIDNKSSR